MAIWKPLIGTTRKTKSGNRRSRYYTGSFTDPNTGRRVRCSLRTTDRSAAEVLLNDLQRRAALAKGGCIDPYESHANRPLVEHVGDWHNALISKGNTRRHADDSRSRVLRIIEDCGFTRWGDIAASRVQGWLGDARKGESGLSTQTANYYLQAFKAFCTWAVKDRRAAESPVRHLDGFNTETDRRHDRRALPDDELRVLLAATKAGPVRYGITAISRYWLYRLAVSSGLAISDGSAE